MVQVNTPSRPRHVRGAARTDAETRAGPGDVGASEAPRPLPRSDQYRRRNSEAGPFTLAIVCLGALVVALLWAIL